MVSLLIAKMTIINTVLFVLFAGILSSATAQYGIRGRQQGLTNYQKYTELLKRECKRNGGPEAYDLVERSEGTLIRCISSTLKVLESESKTTGVPIYNIDKSTVSKFCPQASNFKNCLRSFAETLKTCYEPKDREAVNVNYNAMNTLTDFVCAGGESLITALLTGSEVHCSNFEMNSIAKCSHKMYENYVLAGVTSQRTLQSPRRISEGTILENYQLCAIRALSTCKTSTSTTVVDSVFDSFNQNTRSY